MATDPTPADVFPIYRVTAVHADHMKSKHYHAMMFRTEAESEPRFAQLRAELGDEFTLETRLTHHETWCPGWFSHWTFRDRLAEADVVGDFNRYVQRATRRWPQDASNETKSSDGWVCLMGAEDYWRWRGDSDDSSVPPPCKCADCEKGGVWRVLH